MRLSKSQKTLSGIRPSIFGLNVKSLPFASAAALFIVLASGLMEAQKVVGESRPATVPAGYVITPFGYFHPTCFKRLWRGDTVQENEGVIRHADGSSDSLQACRYPHYDAHGVAASDAQGQGMLPSISHSWIEAYSVTTSSSFYQLTATWTVPSTPTLDGQTIYLFPGMEDANDVVSILQPVLGWNSDYTNAWGIASWNCCISGTTYESSPVSVKSGDTINGDIRSACFTGVESCGSWNIYTTDQTSGNSTALTLSKSDGQTFNWAFAGALEVYKVSQCNDYPPSYFMSFYDVQLEDYNGNIISSPGWSFNNFYSGLTPQCSYGGSEVSQNVILYYGKKLSN